MVSGAQLAVAASELAAAGHIASAAAAAIGRRREALAHASSTSAGWWSGARGDRFRLITDDVVERLGGVTDIATVAMLEIERTVGLAEHLGRRMLSIERRLSDERSELRRAHLIGEGADVGLSTIRALEFDARAVEHEWLSHVAGATRRLRDVEHSIPLIAPLCARGDPGDACPGTRTLSTATPSDAATWWAGLGTARRLAAIATAPSTIGNLDGIPTAARFEANRLVMQAELDAATPGSAEWRRLEQFTSVDAPDRIDPTRQILVFDLDGDGRVAEAFGEPEAADHIAVVVPGMGSTLDGFADMSDRGRRLGAASGPRTAVIAWTGYDTPRAFDISLAAFEVASDRQAIVGGRRLRRLVDSLRSESPSAAVTLVGHSYGSLTVGHALRDGTQVDRVVFMGSPGVGADSVDAFPAGAADEFFASEIKGDLIADLEHFGENPTDPDFGATVFDSGDGDGSHPLSRHGEYYDDGIAISNLVTIVEGGVPTSGRTDLVDHLTEPLEDLDHALHDGIDRLQEIELPWFDEPVDSMIDAAQRAEQTVVQAGEIVIGSIGHFGQDAVGRSLERVGAWFG